MDSLGNVSILPEPDHVQCFSYPLVNLSFIQTHHLQAKRDLVKHAHAEKLAFRVLHYKSNTWCHGSDAIHLVVVIYLFHAADQLSKNLYPS
jgi:hypothetical protein